MRKAIAELDNSLFIGEGERATNTIDPNLPLDKLMLNQQEIIRQVLEKVSGVKL